jgi:hypothetical protein
MNSDSCTPTTAVSEDAVGQEAISQEAVSAAAESKPVVQALLIFDSTSGKVPDLAAVGPYYAKYELGITDSSAIRGAGSWSEIESVLKSYSHVENLYLLVHGYFGRATTGEVQTFETLFGTVSTLALSTSGAEIEIGGQYLDMAAVASKFGGSDMPSISAVHFDGCSVGLDVEGMYLIGSGINASSLTAWPLLVGFSVVDPTMFIDVDDQAIQDLISENSGYILGSPSSQDVRSDGLVLAWLAAKETSTFPTETVDVPEEPRESGESLADYRARTNHFRRDRANTISFPLNDDSNASAAAEAMYKAIVDLRAWTKETGVDPYTYVMRVEVR